MSQQQQQRPQERPRSKSGLSFVSHKSRDSISKLGNGPESPKEKQARRMTSHSKADPSVAINEAQPAVQALEKPTIESLSSIQHRDFAGNVITDPDLSNPTRPRLERPLDTIRSFEAAIDGSYSRRYSTKTPVDMSAAQSRRSSYFGFSPPSRQQYVDHGGYYGNRNDYGTRTPMTRPMSYADPEPAPAFSSHPAVRKFGPRTVSDPMLYGNQAYSNNSSNPYTRHEPQPSYDLTTTSASSGSRATTDQWGNSTDPSSENSSIDRQNYAVPAKVAPPQPDLGEQYGFSGFGGAPPQLQGPILEEYNSQGPAYGEPGYGRQHYSGGAGNPYQGNGATPPRQAQRPRPPPPVTRMTSNGNDDVDPVSRNGYTSAGVKPQAEKRKSWLKRAFSKSGR